MIKLDTELSHPTSFLLTTFGIRKISAEPESTKWWAVNECNIIFGWIVPLRHKSLEYPQNVTNLISNSKLQHLGLIVFSLKNSSEGVRYILNRIIARCIKWYWLREASIQNVRSLDCTDSLTLINGAFGFISHFSTTLTAKSVQQQTNRRYN